MIRSTNNHVIARAGFTLRGARGTLPYSKSGPGYCITFMKRLDEDLTLQPL